MNNILIHQTQDGQTKIEVNLENETIQKFFATVQNKMHYAVHGKTAEEVIYCRADAEKDFMGLTSWRGYLPEKHYSEIAKNYLSQNEIEVLNRIVTLYLEFAELQAIDQKKADVYERLAWKI